jgi:hypothetical protein
MILMIAVEASKLQGAIQPTPEEVMNALAGLVCWSRPVAVGSGVLVRIHSVSAPTQTQCLVGCGQEKPCSVHGGQ